LDSDELSAFYLVRTGSRKEEYERVPLVSGRLVTSEDDLCSLSAACITEVTSYFRVVLCVEGTPYSERNARGKGLDKWRRHEFDCS
jgi:hypothetical protein